MLVNRLKKNESTLCTFTITGEEIIEGHILGYGDNYPLIVVYDKYEGKFATLEFGYGGRYPYRDHDLTSYTSPYEILGHIDNPNDWEKYISKFHIPTSFDYMENIKKYYNQKYKDIPDGVERTSLK